MTPKMTVKVTPKRQRMILKKQRMILKKQRMILKNGEYDTKNDTKNGTLTAVLQEVNNDAMNIHDTKMTPKNKE